jgi:hypothetical protein
MRGGRLQGFRLGDWPDAGLIERAGGWGQRRLSARG